MTDEATSCGMNIGHSSECSCLSLSFSLYLCVCVSHLLQVQSSDWWMNPCSSPGTCLGWRRLTAGFNFFFFCHWSEKNKMSVLFLLELQRHHLDSAGAILKCSQAAVMERFYLSRKSYCTWVFCTSNNDWTSRVGVIYAFSTSHQKNNCFSSACCFSVLQWSKVFWCPLWQKQGWFNNQWWRNNLNIQKQKKKHSSIFWINE